jgi:glycosyltransferase involved in cell wall biosynthesis
LSRPTLFSVPGGDTVQILKTAESLRSIGCDVEMSVEPDPDLRGYDLLHIFNITRPQSLLPALKSRKMGIPVLLSPIYVDYHEVNRVAQSLGQRLLFRLLSGSSAEYLKIAARAVFNGEFNRGTMMVLRRGFRRSQISLINLSAALLPNSESEMRRILANFSQSRNKPYAVVPNSVDHRLFDLQATAPAEEFRDCILSVGRIERRKCQLELVRALKGTGLRLVFVGEPGPNHLAYYEQIRREADASVTFIGQLEHSELPRYYAACKVHALVSWMETTGLSSLEAGVMGANLVITPKGDTREYFGDHAFYCSPDSVASIRDAVLAAHRAPRSSALREKILQHYTWDIAASRTIAAYRSVLSNAGSLVARSCTSHAG